MIEKIDTNQIKDVLEKSPFQQSEPAKSPSSDNIDASLQITYDSLIEQAIQTQQTDDEAVQQAEELLASGQLESPENIMAAAENIIDLGI